jgi:flagellar hook-associated protein FlgK
VTAVGTNSFEVNLSTVLAGATVAGEVPATAGTSALPPYEEIEAGEKTRTAQSGTFSANLSGNAASEYYDITLTVSGFNEDPNATTAQQTGTVTYRVYNNVAGMRNDRVDVMSTGGSAEREFPSTPHQYIFARLVDENGTELPKTNNSYGEQSGYLQLVANDLDGTEFTIAVSEGDSQQQGNITDEVPPVIGTNRGFSHYYELNNLFVSNEPSFTGDTISGSAINLAVSDRILDNPSLISTGTVEQSNQPADPDAPRLYTFERYIGNNSIAQALAEVNFTQLNFAEAGGLPGSNQTLNGYIGEFLGFTATQTVSAKVTFSDVNALLEGLVQRSDAISGVNLDEELASTTLYQNAYSASAQVISVTNELFDALFGAFN